MDERIVALDVGTTRVRCVIAELQNDEDLAILGYGVSPNEGGIKQGNIVDINRATEAIIQAVGEAEERAKINPVQDVCLSITGDHIKSYNPHGAITIKKESQEITRLDLDQVVNAARDQIDLKSNRFQLIHNIPQFFEVDGQRFIENPIGMVGSKLDVHLHSIAAARSAVINLQRCCDLAKLEMSELVFKGLATAEAVLSEDQKKLGAVVVDLGGGTTDLVVYMEGKITHSASIPIGGEFVTKDIAMGMKIPTQAAETLKHKLAEMGLETTEEKVSLVVDRPGGQREENLDVGLLKKIVHARLEEIFDHVRAQLDRLEQPDLAAKSRIAAGVILAGAGSRFRGLSEFARKILEMNVEPGAIRPGPKNLEPVADIEFATAIGLLKYAIGVHTPLDLPELREGLLGRFVSAAKRVMDRLFGES